MKCQGSWTGQCETWMSVWVPSASHLGPWGQYFRAHCGSRPAFFFMSLWTCPEKHEQCRKPCQLAQNSLRSAYHESTSHVGREDMNLDGGQHGQVWIWGWANSPPPPLISLFPVASPAGKCQYSLSWKLKAKWLHSLHGAFHPVL